MIERPLTSEAAIDVHRAAAFRIDEEKGHEGGVVLAPHGDLDLKVAPELQDRIAAAIEDGANAVVIDLSAVTFIDSMGLGVLIGAAHRLEPRGGRLRLVVPAPQLRRIFELTLLDQVFPLDRTRDEALTRLLDG
jgi:anti-sigma B factor antagonist